MKKCGRFVAGMFGTSLSLAMLSGAFLMANKGAVEAKAADGDVVITLDNEDFGRAGTNTVLTAEKGGVSFEGKFRTTNDTGTTDYDYLMFDKGGSYLTNTTSLAGYYVSGISWNYTKGTGVSGSVYHSFLTSSNNSVSAVGVAAKPVKGGNESFANDDQSLAYFNISNKSANVQFDNITITFSPTTSYDHISVSGQPTKTEYYVGDSFLTDGLTVNAYTTAEDTDPTDVTDLVQWTIDPATFNDTATTSVTVTATFGDFTSEPYTVNGLTVSPAATVTDLIITGPTKATYGYGEAIDLAGLKIEAKMSDGKTNDVTSEIEIADHTIDLADVIAGKYDIAISYKNVEKTLSLIVNEEVVTIAQARESKDEVVFAGTITGITGVYSDSSDVNVYIADSTGAIMLYRFNPTMVQGGELTVGNKIYAAAKTTVYNGLTETAQNGISELYVSGKGEEIAAKKVTDLTATGLDGLDSSVIAVEGLEYVSGSVGTSSKAGDITLKYGENTVAMRAPTNAAAGVLNEAGFDDWLEKTSGLPFNFTGHLGWYNKPQLAPISMDDVACPVYDEIKVFIDTYMHMDKTEKDQCLTLFPAAKEALDKLSETARECFLNYEGENQEIVSAKVRYHAWSVAVGDQSAASVIMNTVNENKGAIIAVSAVAALGIAGAAALLISRKKRSAKNK